MQLLFDLDGTLSDSSRGIIRCLAHTMRVLGQEVPSIPRLRRCVGPPLATVFRSLLTNSDNDDIERAIAIYRERYEATGISESALFPGIAEALDTLHKSKHCLQLVTAKPEPYARRILDQSNIAAFFSDIFAPTLDDRVTTKSVLVRTALAVGTHDKSDIAMIGDRAEDIMAARENRIFSAAAAWGYGTLEEIAEAKPDRICYTMTEYVHWIESRDGPINQSD
jgi:phosphoglycolate phosphatase